MGNLESRTDNNQSLTEAFAYDALNRLMGGTLNGVPNLQTSYLPDGSLESKRRPDGTMQSYSYATPGKPHAVSATTYGTHADYYTYDAAGQLLTRAYDSPSAFNRWVSWTAFGKPKQVSVGAANCAADCTTFTYGPDRELVKQVVKAAGSTRSIYYIGPHFEVEVGGGVTEYRSHALANGQVVFTQIEDSGGVGWQAYYPLRDHLGSVDKQYQAIGGGVQTLAYSYDAYGRRRNADWSDDPGGSQMTATLWNHRGYTGHEMLDNVALVHMKGRVYDPTLGMFLSPDPLLDDLNMPQSLNPYGYVAGNPLSFTDPTGYGLRHFIRRLTGLRWMKHVTREVVTVAIYFGCMVGTDGIAEAGGGCSSIAYSVGRTMPEIGKASQRASSATGGWTQPSLGQFGGGYDGSGTLRMNAVADTGGVKAERSESERRTLGERPQGKSLVEIQDETRNDPRFVRDPITRQTYCNLATQCIVTRLGGPTGDLKGRANDMAMNLRSSSDWRQVSAEEAQKLANQLALVVVSYYNPNGSGHVSTVRPEGIPGDNPSGGTGPLINDIGQVNAVRRESRAFRRGSDVRYYTPK